MYFLDYLRYGKISLPMTVPRDVFLRDMEFYGFLDLAKTVKEGGNLVDDSFNVDECDAHRHATSHLLHCFESCRRNLETARNEMKALETKVLYIQHAMVYAKRYIFDLRDGATLEVDLLQRNDDDLLNRCLAKFGLTLVRGGNELVHIDTL